MRTNLETGSFRTSLGTSLGTGPFRIYPMCLRKQPREGRFVFAAFTCAYTNQPRPQTAWRL